MLTRRLWVGAGMATAALALALTGWMAGAADQDKYDQSKVPLEVQPADKSLVKIDLIAGRASHGPGEHEFFAGSAVLMKLLKETPRVFPVMARDGWPKDPEATFAHARTLVFFMDGGKGHPVIRGNHMEVIQKLMDHKVGFVNLHYAVEYPKEVGQQVLSWLG